MGAGWKPKKQGGDILGTGVLDNEGMMDASQHGEEHKSGGPSFVLFRNTKKKHENSPDFQIVVPRKEDDEPEEDFDWGGGGGSDTADDDLPF